VDGSSWDLEHHTNLSDVHPYMVISKVFSFDITENYLCFPVPVGYLHGR
jgi:hypothetical protein